MAEEIDVEKCNFRNSSSSVTLILTLDWVDVTLVRISGRGLPTHQIRSKSEKLFVDGQTYIWTDGQTYLSSNLYDLKLNFTYFGKVFFMVVLWNRADHYIFML